MSHDYPEFVARFYDTVYAKLRDGVDNDYYLARIAASPGPVLEIGVGTGRLFCEALRRGADIEGLDISPSMIARARAKLAGARASPPPAGGRRLGAVREALRPGHRALPRALARRGGGRPAAAAEQRPRAPLAGRALRLRPVRSRPADPRRRDGGARGLRRRVCAGTAPPAAGVRAFRRRQPADASDACASCGKRLAGSARATGTSSCASSSATSWSTSSRARGSRSSRCTGISRAGRSTPDSREFVVTCRRAQTG